MKRVLLVAAILAGVPACVPTLYLPESPPQSMTVALPVAPEAAYGQARQAVAAMGGRLLNHDATVRLAFARVPGPVVLHSAVLPDRHGAAVQVIGHVGSTHPVGDASGSSGRMPSYCASQRPVSNQGDGGLRLHTCLNPPVGRIARLLMSWFYYENF